MATLSKYIDNDKNNFIQYIENLSSDGLSEMLATRILPSFIATVRRNGITSFSQNALTYWIVDMLRQPLKPTTVLRYLGALHSLYSLWIKDSGIDENNCIAACNISFTIPDGIDIEKYDLNQIKRNLINLKLVRNILKIKSMPFSKEFIYQKAFLYLLANPTISLGDIIDMKFSDYQPEYFGVNELKESMRKMPQAKYVFPLGQGKHRRQAIVHDLLSGMHSVARKCGLDFGDSFSRESISALWIAAALRENITLTEIRTLMLKQKLPSAFAFMSVVSPSCLTEERIAEIFGKIANLFVSSTNGWFVMRMRLGITPDMIREELIHRKSPIFRQVEFFYPTRKQKKIVKNKTAIVNTPVIPSILFFKTRYDRISSLMSVIGNMAWCYRSCSSQDSPYSTIPLREMKIFQRSLEANAKDMEMDLISSLPPLSVGDEVVIENGTILDGQHAVIRKVRKKDGSLIYSLRLSDSEFIQWKECILPANDLTKICDD